MKSTTNSPAIYSPAAATLRRHLADMTPVEAMEFMEDRINKTRNNEEFLVSMNS